MNPWIFLFVWAGSQALQFTFGVASLRQNPVASGGKWPRALVVSGATSILPLATLLLFLKVFVIGGSLNVAQIAGRSGYGLWSLWSNAWPLLLFGNPLAFLGAAVAVFLPPYSPSPAVVPCQSNLRRRRGRLCVIRRGYVLPRCVNGAGGIICVRPPT